MSVTGPLFLVAAGLGAAARVMLDGWVDRRLRREQFPAGILAVNLVGCLVLGVVVGASRAHGLDTSVSTVIGTGGLGAFTTFSTFGVDTVRLVENGQTSVAARNVVATIVGGLVAAAVGLTLAGGW